MFQSSILMRGNVVTQVQRAPGPGLAWKARNMLRWGYIWGWLVMVMAHAFSRVTGVAVLLV